MLDVSTKFLRSLSPSLNQRLVTIGQERRRRNERDWEDLKFEEFRKSFDAIVQKQEKPARRRVQRDVFERTGLTFRYQQTTIFLKRARALADADADTRRGTEHHKPVGERRRDNENRPSMD